jgi:hypothetical protein
VVLDHMLASAFTLVPARLNERQHPLALRAGRPLGALGYDGVTRVGGPGPRTYSHDAFGWEWAGNTR